MPAALDFWAQGTRWGGVFVSEIEMPKCSKASFVAVLFIAAFAAETRREMDFSKVERQPAAATQPTFCCDFPEDFMENNFTMACSTHV